MEVVQTHFAEQQAKPNCTYTISIDTNLLIKRKGKQIARSGSHN